MDEAVQTLFISRLRNGFLVRADLDDEWYCPHERAVVAKVISLLGIESELRLEPVTQDTQM